MFVGLKFKIRISLLLLAVVCLTSSLVLGASLGDLVVTPETVILTLPRSSSQTIKLSTTPKPMKVILDFTEPVLGFAPSLQINDLALKEVRYTEQKDGNSRLVLEFNYQVSDPKIEEAADYYRLVIPKTYVNTTERIVISGVVYGHQRRVDSFGPNVVNYLKISTKYTGIEVKLALAQDRVFGSEHVSGMAERYGAIAAINGAFFASDGRPLGAIMIDGDLISEPYANRTALGLGKNKLVMEGLSWQGDVSYQAEPFAKLTGINRPRLQDELIVYTPAYGSQTRTNDFGQEVTIIDGVVTAVTIGNSVIPANGVVLSGHGVHKALLASLALGDQLEIKIALTPDWQQAGIEQIIGGGPRLVRDGQIEITGEAELFRPDITQGRAPRTALGITEDGKLLLVTVNGRQPNISVGMSLVELANLLLELGAVQAMNLDGGGSTTMVIRNLVLNLPSDGKERPVSNSIIILPPK